MLTTKSYLLIPDTAILSDKDFSVSLHNKIEDIPDLWNEVIPNELFYSIDFLSAVEACPPYNMESRYILFYKDQKPVGVSVVQVKFINIDESLKIDENQSTLFGKINTCTKKALSKRVRFVTLVCGNLLLTGKYGFHFCEDYPMEKQFELVDDALDLLMVQLKSENISSDGILMKDFEEEERRKNTDRPNGKYSEFSVQPNMHLDIRDHWKTFSDYLSDMKSKYRVRAKSALKKCKKIEKRLLSLDEIKDLETDIDRLYQNIAKTASFNLFILQPGYFWHLKNKLGDKIEITGYFLEGKLIGFYSSIYNYKVLDAHFLGYDPKYNNQFQLYLNMLYGLIEKAIDHGMERVEMSRTAMEIKSSVGAIPTDRYLYVRHKSPFKNKHIIPRVLKFLTPQKEWIPRVPFKD